jgi:hypothetical protein
MIRNETRICPVCGKEIEIEPVLETKSQTECQCGAKLNLEWERIETENGPEDIIYFEKIRP